MTLLKPAPSTPKFYKLTTDRNRTFLDLVMQCLEKKRDFAREEPGRPGSRMRTIDNNNNEAISKQAARSGA